MGSRIDESAAAPVLPCEDVLLDILSYEAVKKTTKRGRKQNPSTPSEMCTSVEIASFLHNISQQTNFGACIRLCLSVRDYM